MGFVHETLEWVPAPVLWTGVALPVAVLGTALAAFKAPRWRRWELLAGLPGALLLVHGLATAWCLHALVAAWPLIGGPQDPATIAATLAESIGRALNTIAFATIIVEYSAPVWAVLAVALAKRLSPERFELARVAAIVFAIPLQMGSWASVAWFGHLVESFASVANSDVEQKYLVLHRGLLESLAGLQELRLTTLSTTGVGALVLLGFAFRAARRGWSPPKAWTPIAAALFAAGLGAWGLSRGAWADAQRPLTPFGNGEMLAHPDRAPKLASCSKEDARRLPVVDLTDPAGPRLDATPLTGPLDEAVRLAWDKWRAYHPAGNPSYEIVVEARPDASVADVMATLAPALRAQFPKPLRAYVFAHEDRVDHTATMGDLLRRKGCMLPITVAEESAPPVATWGELAQRLAAGEAVPVALP